MGRRDLRSGSGSADGQSLRRFKMRTLLLLVSVGLLAVVTTYRHDESETIDLDVIADELEDRLQEDYDEDIPEYVEKNDPHPWRRRRLRFRVRVPSFRGRRFFRRIGSFCKKYPVTCAKAAKAGAAAVGDEEEVSK